jgi:hypothetical protein
MAESLKSKYATWPAMLASIREKPGMWIGRKTLTALECFWMGFVIAEEFHCDSEDARLSGFDWTNFESWADQRFNPARLSINSFEMARTQAKAEDAAFDLWFSWYDVFRAEIR